MRKTFSIVLDGAVPSKKNAWKHGPNNVYIDKSLKGELDFLLYQIIRKRNELGMDEPLTGSIRFEATFKVTRVHCDLDNMATTVLDLLQKGLIIKNDKLVSEIIVKRLVTPIPGPCTHIKVSLLPI